ncbi:MAG: heparan-alpha-glucosaminide N-acetyltransferase [Albidovulum sp.]
MAAGDLSAASKRRRIPALDIARTVALIAMAIYHFTFDLEMFGYLAPGTSVSGGWAIFARMVAGSFLFLVGVSLYLGHGDGIRWRPFLRRLAMIAGAAALITAGTRYAMPDNYIFFGILHSITAASLLGLLFLRLPAPITLAAAALVVFARPYLQNGWFDAPVLAGLGLTTWPVRSADFVPVFPWFAATLAGIGAAKIGRAAGFWHWLAARGGGDSALLRRLAWPGRHSLAVYLIHQPVLIGLLWTYTRYLR